MKRNYLILLFALFLINCKKSDSSNNGVTNGVTHDVYVSGWEIRPTAYPDIWTIPKYWVNGKEVFLPDISYREAIATGITVIGNDVYVAGDSTYSHIPMYWKNGKLRAVNVGSILSDPDLKQAIAANNQFWKYGAGLPYNLTGTNNFPHVTVNAVCISGTDVYAVGAVDNIIQTSRNTSSGTSLAVYWKNGTIMALEDSLKNSYSEGKAIQVVGSDVYVVGYSQNTNGTNGVCWKNGILYHPEGNLSNISGITVVGNNVYVSGQSSLGFPPMAQYWENGVAFELRNSGPLYYLSESSNGISVKDNKVYSAGKGYNLVTTSAVLNYAIYWINDQPVILNNATGNWEEATGIFVK
jgi:hypothetical protein